MEFIIDTVPGKDTEFNRNPFADVLQETWKSAIKNLHKFDGSRGRIEAWLRGICKNAVKKVRRQYDIPDPIPGDHQTASRHGEIIVRNSEGTIKQIIASDDAPFCSIPGDGDAPVRQYNASLDDMFGAGDLDEEGDNPVELKLHPDWGLVYGVKDAPCPEFEHILADLQANSILQLAAATAPPTVFAALEMIAVEDYSLNQAALHLGVHRKTLTRHIRTWAEDNQLDQVMALGD